MTSLVTVRKKVQQNFTIVRNEIVRDERLSWKAVGLLIYLLSLPPNWQINIVHLSKIRPDGSTSTRSGIEELRKCGYLAITRDRDERGKFVAVVWTVTDTPMSKSKEKCVRPTSDYPRAENPHVDIPNTAIQQMDNPNEENPSILSTKVSKTEKYRKRATTTSEHYRHSSSCMNDQHNSAKSLCVSGADEATLDALIYPALSEQSIAALRELLPGCSSRWWQPILDETEGRRRAGLRTRNAEVAFAGALVDAANAGKFRPSLGIEVQREREIRIAKERELTIGIATHLPTFSKINEEGLRLLPEGMRRRAEASISTKNEKVDNANGHDTNS